MSSAMGIERRPTATCASLEASTKVRHLELQCTLMWTIRTTSSVNEAIYSELEAALKNASMSPQPSRVLPWRALLADSDDDVAEGWVAQYDLRDLETWRAERRGRMASLEAPLRAENAGSVDELWMEAERQIETIVRRFGLLMRCPGRLMPGRARPGDVVMDDLGCPRA